MPTLRVSRPPLQGVPALIGGASRMATIAGSVAAIGAGAYLAIGRDRLVRWGATDAELRSELPGDAYVPRPEVGSTRATNVAGSPHEVWARAFPDVPGPRVGDRLALPVPGWIPSTDALSLYTAAVAPGSHIVLATWDPAKESAGDRVARGEWAATWVLVLRPRSDGMTRIVTRFRAAYPAQPDAPAMSAIALEPIVFILERRILGRIGRSAIAPRRAADTAR